jgi:putative CocE/NonD family hydrolase
MSLRIPCRAAAVVILVLASLGAARREGPYGLAWQKDVMVPMRDAVRLAADVYLPTLDDKPVTDRLPTILMRIPYNKRAGEKPHSDARYFASHGYAVVFQDTRGRYKSEGVWHMLADEGPDGYDTAEWIARQPWSNGKIGMIGTSYVGGTQHALAMTKNPHLSTVIPVDAMSNLGYASMRNGGAFELRFWNWIMLNAGRGSRHARDPATESVLKEMAENRKMYLANLPLRPGTTPLRLAPDYEQWLVAGMRHGANDEFWRQNNIIDHADQYKDIPVYLVGGWYDSWASNTTANFVALRKAIRGPVYLIMGPWIHGAQGSASHGQVSFGTAAAIADPLAWRREWYDHWLKGIDNSVGKADPFATPVRIFVMGTGTGRKTNAGLLDHGGFWRNEQEWPLTRTRYTPYYLQSGGKLSSALPKLTAGRTSFQFDPRRPVPTIGGCTSSGNDILLAGAWDQRGGPHVWNFHEPIPLSARNDVLVFQTDALAADLEVTGEIVVKLWISSSAPDTDFTAKLIDVCPPNADFPGGFDLNITDGIFRTRFRKSLAREELLKPGEIAPVEIKLYPTANVFRRGHHIRVDISSSNFPRFDVNPNTGEPLNDNRRTAVATNTVFHDREHPSQIVLPVIPATGGSVGQH